MVLFSRVTVNILCASALLLSFKAFSAEDEYLKMLEGEAEDLQLDQSGQLQDTNSEIKSSKEDIDNKKWKWEGELEGNALPPGLGQDQFASLLEENFYGSFVFYRKLNSNDQQTVYYHYTKASPANLDAIRQDILDHLKR